MNLTGLQIVPSAFALQRRQFRFPRSKRRRIRAKWAQRRENFKDLPALFQVGSTLFCHPRLVARLTRNGKES